MKRNITSLFLAVVLLVAIAAPAQAIIVRDQRVPLAGSFTLLALGDGVSAGAGLADGSADSDFVSLSASALNMSPVNHAIDGLTSDGLLAMLAEPDDALAGDLACAAVVCVSIGGNDLLDLVYAIVGEALSLEPGDISGVQGKLAEMWEAGDSAGQQALQLNALLALPKWTGAAAERLAANLVGVVEAIREYNPEATIVALTLYNPYIGVEELSMLTTVMDTVLDIFNGIIYAGESECLIADVGAFFKGSDKPLTNAADGSEAFNPLPNADGHALIAEIVAELVNVAALAEMD